MLLEIFLKIIKYNINIHCPISQNYFNPLSKGLLERRTPLTLIEMGLLELVC